jgi:hypothetical protein
VEKMAIDRISKYLRYLEQGDLDLYYKLKKEKDKYKDKKRIEG